MIDYGQGVELGPLLKENLPDMFYWRNQYSTWKTCRQNSVLSLESHEAWFDSLQDDPTVKMFSIRPAETTSDGIPVDIYQRFVGVCGFTSIDQVNQKAEFSLYIGSEYRKKGFAKAALKTLLSHGFNNLNLNSIWGECFEGNQALNMFEDLGFEREGFRREAYFRDGAFIGAYMVSMLRSDWTSGVQRCCLRYSY